MHPQRSLAGAPWKRVFWPPCNLTVEEFRFNTAPVATIQTLYIKDPDRGRPVMRNPSAAQIHKLHQLRSEDCDLSLQTAGLGSGAGAASPGQSLASKISTPDRHIAAGLLAACMAPFPHAAKKDRHRTEPSSTAKDTSGGAARASSTADGAEAQSNGGTGGAGGLAASSGGGASASQPAPNAPQVQGNLPVAAPPALPAQVPVMAGGVPFHLARAGLPVQVRIRRIGWVDVGGRINTCANHEQI